MFSPGENTVVKIANCWLGPTSHAYNIISIIHWRVLKSMPVQFNAVSLWNGLISNITQPFGTEPKFWQVFTASSSYFTAACKMIIITHKLKTWMLNWNVSNCSWEGMQASMSAISETPPPLQLWHDCTCNARIVPCASIILFLSVCTHCVHLFTHNI